MKDISISKRTSVEMLGLGGVENEQMQKLELHHGKNFNTKMHQLMQGEQLLLPYIININIHNSSYGNNHSYVYICIYTG